jgi:hypothetical protein
MSPYGESAAVREIQQYEQCLGRESLALMNSQPISLLFRESRQRGPKSGHPYRLPTVLILCLNLPE